MRGPTHWGPEIVGEHSHVHSLYSLVGFEGVFSFNLK